MRAGGAFPASPDTRTPLSHEYRCGAYGWRVQGVRVCHGVRREARGGTRHEGGWRQGGGWWHLGGVVRVGGAFPAIPDTHTPW